ncbi:MAG: spheroidene monooxygenase [Solirubrobacteraceae bacterium]
MIVTVHICAPGPARAIRAFRACPAARTVEGLTHAQTLLTAPLGGGLLPRPNPSEIALLASWEEESKLDRFLEDASLAGPFADGWHVRMRPLRVFGCWRAMPGLPTTPTEVEPDEPVAVLTLGRPRKARLLSFARAAAAAEAELERHAGLLAATGLAHPPRLVSTFSLWRSTAEMRGYAHDAAGAHSSAVRRDRAEPFHHESAFIRLKPYHSAGTWGTRDPLLSVLPRC